MGRTYKKTLRAEKAKVKLKGVKLPKGLNITKTEFKVKKITIREQLKESQYVEGQRQTNLKETLTRLKHHSVNFRLDALRHLREAILYGNPGVLAHLNEVIQGVVAICLDVERQTRKESFKVLNTLLGTLGLETVAPFFHIISSYLRCAMTHIQTAVQEDSLLLLDVLLQHVPRLVAVHSTKIFQNFLEMISRVRVDGDRAGRTLVVQVGNRKTMVKWRSEVLQRLQQMLQALATYNRENSRRNSSKSSSGSKHTCRLVSYNPNLPQHYAVRRRYVGKCDISALFIRTIGVNDGGFITSANEATILRNYVTHLMPLLLEAWMEVRPQDGSSEQLVQPIISLDAAVTLKVILEIMRSLWCLVEIYETEMGIKELSDWFQQEYCEAFVNSFMHQTFPYQQAAGLDEPLKKRAKKSAQETGGQFCVEQNLCIAYLVGRFYLKRMAQQTEKCCNLLKYLLEIVRNVGTYGVENCQNLEPVLRLYLLHNGRELYLLHPKEMRLLLTATIEAFLKQQFPGKDGIAAKILILLCDIVQTREVFEAYNPSEFNTFLEHLPQLLLKPSINETVLVSMSSLGKQKNYVFLQALKNVIAPVIDNIIKIQVIGAENTYEGKKHIMNLFYWIEKDWDNDKQKELVEKVENNVKDKRILSYYKFIITGK